MIPTLHVIIVHIGGTEGRLVPDEKFLQKFRLKRLKQG